MAYQDHEEEFLTAIAPQFGFTKPKYEFLFIQRHLEKNLDLTHEAFAETFEQNLRELGVRATNLPQWVRDHLSQDIWQKLGRHGVDAVRQWLKTEKYPQWLTNQTTMLWNKLWQLGTYTENIYPTIHAPKLDGLTSYPKRLRTSITMVPNTDFIYQIHESLEGYLVWLERDAEDNIDCLAPSYLAPSLKIKSSTFTTFPQPDSDSPILVVGDELGEEQVLVITLPKDPSWQWLADKHSDVFAMEAEYLDQLFDEVRSAGVQIKKMSYKIVAAIAQD